MTTLPIAWFCDVDGVIAQTGRQPGRDYVVRHLGGWQGSVLLDVDVILSIGHLIHTGLVDFHWCTNWEMDAQILLEPILGFPRLPLAAPPVTSGRWWKAQAVREHAATEAPFTWTDDEIDNIGGADVDDLRAAGLLISTSISVGLTVADVERIEAYARQHAHLSAS